MVGWKSVTGYGSRESAKLPAEENTSSLAQCFPFTDWTGGRAIQLPCSSHSSLTGFINLGDQP